MTKDQQRDEMGALVLQFIAGVVLHNHDVAQRVGLGASDGQFVSLLTVHGPLTAGRLAELTGLTSGSVTAVIDRLEARGYVERVRTPLDKRKVLVTPRPEGLAELASHYAGYGAAMDGILRKRSVAELAVLIDFFREMVEVDAA